MSADIFISFASQDAKIASTICRAVESRGFKCWISSRDILPGENFQSSIVRAIRGAKVLLLVFTANSNRSDEMTKELALASQQKLMVVPLRVENVTPGDAFAYEFATRQWIDLFADWELAMNNLGSRLAAALQDDRTHTDTIVLGKPSLREPGTANLIAAMQRNRTLGIGAAAVVLAGVVVMTALHFMGNKQQAQQAAAAQQALALDPATASMAAVAQRLGEVMTPAQQAATEGAAGTAVPPEVPLPPAQQQAFVTAPATAAPVAAPPASAPVVAAATKQAEPKPEAAKPQAKPQSKPKPAPKPANNALPY